MSNFFQKILRPMLFRMDAERAHELGIKALQLGLARPKELSDIETSQIKEVFGPIQQFGLDFDNPLGIAAGFDKNAAVVDQLSTLGFGFVEVGTVTFEPQPGNPKPRLFRLPADRALVNRLGFNNDGAQMISDRLAKKKGSSVVGVNIGRNKQVQNDNAVENYLNTLEVVHPVADYIAVNVSSPNTPNLRQLQSSEHLSILLTALQKRNTELGAKPILLKIAPDLDNESIESIVDICLQTSIGGMIATNTTTSREGLITANPQQFGDGGLSGRPLAKRSNDIIEVIYRHAQGKMPIIGTGGILTAKDAFEKIARGASLIQAYTGFIYSGPSFPIDIIIGLAQIIKGKGFRDLSEAVGSAVK